MATYSFTNSNFNLGSLLCYLQDGSPATTLPTSSDELNNDNGGVSGTFTGVCKAGSVHLTANSGIQISGGTFDCSDFQVLGVEADGQSITDCTINGFLTIQDSSDLSITGCTVDSWQYSQAGGNASHNTVNNLSIYGSGSDLDDFFAASNTVLLTLDMSAIGGPVLYVNDGGGGGSSDQVFGTGLQV